MICQNQFTQDADNIDKEYVSVRQKHCYRIFKKKLIYYYLNIYSRLYYYAFIFIVLIYHFVFNVINDV